MVLNFKNLFNTESKKSKLSDFQDLDHLNGLAISITSAGLYNPPRDDLVLFYFRNGANYASVYTCLLYTSPSPRDRQKSRMPSSA